jgi:serine/threonine protein kinase/TolB-like protein/Flp pilus assembly protein TadD
MQKNRWQKIEEIFNRAVALPPAQRERFVKEACPDDVRLCREILLLINADGAEAVFLDEPVFSLGAQLLETDELLPKESAFASYRIKKLLGRGGMGAVYLAEDLRLERPVALKILPASLGGNTEGVMRFRQEARAASAISHPNVAHIYEFGEEGERYFLAMEYVAGKTLRELLREKALDASRALEIVLQVAEALVATHKRGIVHRDIKPENVIVTESGLVKILDFGLAKLNAPQISSENEKPLASLETAPGMIIGTTAYMSPEQVRGQPLDARTDLWSLGVLLFEMLACERPFAGATPSDVQAAILLKDAPLLELPTSAALVAGKLLKKDLNERYQSAEDLLPDLRRLKNEFETQKSSAANSSEKISPKDDGTNEKTESSVFLNGAGDFWNKQSLSRKVLLLAVLIGLLTFTVGVSWQFLTNSVTKSNWQKNYVVPKNLTPIFSFDYKIQPDPGRRVWLQSDNHQWVERQPDGIENVFDEIETVNVEDENGRQLRNIITNLEVFIPDRNDPGRTAYWRSPPNEKWLFFGEITYFTDAETLAEPQNQSVVVLLFDNQTGEAQFDYLSEGLTEDLTRNLGKLNVVRVIDFASARKMRGVTDLPEIRRRLEISSIVRGKVEKLNEKLAVSVEFLNADSGTIVWRDSILAPDNNLLKLRDSLDILLSTNLQSSFGTTKNLVVSGSSTRSEEAYRSYLAGRFAIDRNNLAGIKRAAENLERAAALDPDFAQAYVALAESYNLIGSWFGENPEIYLPKAKAAVEKALRLDEASAEAHTILAKMKMDNEHDWAGCEKEFKRAIELNPNYALAHHWFGEVYLSAMGRFNESISELETARALDPLSSGTITGLAWSYIGKKDYDHAIELCDEALLINAADDSAFSYKSMALMKLGRYAEAIETSEKSSLAGETSELAVIYGLSGRIAEAREMLKRMEKNPNSSPYNLAVIHAALGEKDRAFELLEKQLKTKSVDLLSIRVDPLLDNLRDDPRFEEIERKLNLPEIDK